MGGEGVLDPLAHAGDATELGVRHGGSSLSLAENRGRERLERRKERKLLPGRVTELTYMVWGYLRNRGNVVGIRCGALGIEEQTSC